MDHEQTRRALGGQIPALDGLRGIAILLVACAHFIGGYAFPTTADHAVYEIFRAGWCGVDLFFVLSGFLITGILIETRRAPNFFQAFYARRVLRIFPLYYAFLAFWFFGLGSFAASHGWDPDAIGRDRQAWYWLYAANWMVPRHEAIAGLGHMWSLAVEEQFYIAWPLIVWLSRRRLAHVCIAAIAIAPLFRCILVANGMPSDTAYEWTPARMDALAFGGLLAVMLRDRAAHRFVSRRWPTTLVAGAIALVAIAVANRGLAFNATIVKTVGYSLFAFTAASAIAGAILAPDLSLLRRVLESSFLRAFGRYSYAIYIVHYPLYLISYQKLSELGAGGSLETRSGYAVFALVGIGSSFAIAWLSWHVFEKHFLALKRRFVASPRPRARSRSRTTS